MAVGQETIDQMAPDKPRRAGNQCFHKLPYSPSLFVIPRGCWRGIHKRCVSYVDPLLEAAGDDVIRYPLYRVHYQYALDDKDHVRWRFDLCSVEVSADQSARLIVARKSLGPPDPSGR